MRRILKGILLLSLILFYTDIAFAKDYSSEEKDSYTYHYFEFDKEEAREITDGPFKASTYREWMIEKIKEEAVSMNMELSSITSASAIDFKLASIARLAEREEKEIFKVLMRTQDIGNGLWALELYDTTKDDWKKITE